MALSGWIGTSRSTVKVTVRRAWRRVNGNPWEMSLFQMKLSASAKSAFMMEVPASG